MLASALPRSDALGLVGRCGITLRSSAVSLRQYFRQTISTAFHWDWCATNVCQSNPHSFRTSVPMVFELFGSTFLVISLVWVSAFHWGWLPGVTGRGLFGHSVAVIWH